MECSHRIAKFEESMLELENIASGKLDPPPLNEVPCNGCTLCCKGDAIRILPEDDASQFQTVPHERFPGQLMLDHQENGDCVYLTGSGCSIHGYQPTMCQTMDCRTIARKFKRSDLKRYSCPLSVWKRGRQMIGRIW